MVIMICDVDEEGGKINDQSLIMRTYHVSLRCIHNIKGESTQKSDDMKNRNFWPL